MANLNNLFSGFNDQQNMDRLQKQAKNSLISTAVIVGVFVLLTIVLIIIALIGSAL